MRRKLSLLCLVFIVLLLLVLFLKKSDNDNMNYVSIINNKELVIEKTLPLTDEVGSRSYKADSSSNIYYEFELKSLVSRNCHYKLLLNTKQGDNYIKDEIIKITLSDEKDKVIKNYDGKHKLYLNDLKKYNNQYLLYEGSLKGKVTKKMIIRLWVSDTTLYDDKIIFDGKLSVYSY